MKLYFTFLSFFFVGLSHSQIVKVVDRNSNLPIEGVIIANDVNSVHISTNKNGKVDLSVFNDAEVLYFNHLGFYEFEILKRELGILEFVVPLNKKSEQLDEILLTASKGEEKRSRIAEQYAIIPADEIKRMAPQTSADMLANVDGVKIQKTQAGGGSPVLRGMEANRILLVVDGVRMNNAIYRTGHLQSSITVSPNIIERTEVVFGPSSVIYGSDALGGVIHYFTRTPRVCEENAVNTSVFSRYSSVNNEFTNEANIEIRRKKWASYTSVSHSKFGETMMGKNRQHNFEDWGKVPYYSNNTNSYYNPDQVVNSDQNLQKNTDYSQTDILNKIAIPLSKKADLILNFQYSTSSDIDNFDDLTEYSKGKLKNAESYYGPQKRMLFSSQLKINPEKKWMDNGTITLAYQDIEESRIQRKFNSLDRSYRIENVDVFSLNADFFVPLTKNDNRILSYGFEGSHNDVGSTSYGKTLEVLGNDIIGFSNDFAVQSRYPDGGGTYTSIASYINYRQDISKKSTLNSGIRFVNTNLTAKWIDDTFITLPDFDIQLNNSAVTATIGYVYRPELDWQLNTIVSSGFRAPNLDDVGKIREKNGNVTVPNIELEPEYVYNFESGILKYFNDKAFQINLNAYYTLLTNYITRDYIMFNNSDKILYDGEMGATVSNVNKDNTQIFGGTFGMRGNLNDTWFARGSVTYTKGKELDTNTPLSSIPPLFGVVEVGFEKEQFQAYINWKFNGKKPIDDYNLVEGIDNEGQTPFNSITGNYYGSPSWSTFNISSNYKLSNALTCYLNIDNILDVHYKEFASSISAPGRNVSVSLLLNI